MGIIGVTTGILTAVALVSWIYVVLTKGRTGYNSFSTVPEILQLADPEKMNKLRHGSSERRLVGISRHRPNIEVVDEHRKDECSNSTWSEGDVL